MMTPNEATELAVGDALDKLVAERVMHWDKRGDGWKLGSVHLSASLFMPSSRHEDAFMAVREMRKQGYRLMLRQEPDDMWEATFYMLGWPDTKRLVAALTAESPPLVICRAALATLLRPSDDTEPKRAWRCPSPEALKAGLRNVKET